MNNSPITRYLLPLLVLGSLALPASASDNRATQIDELSRQWLDTERQANVLQSQWQQQKPQLEQRISLLQAEREQLNKVLREHRDTGTAVEEKRRILLREQSQLEEQQATNNSQLQQLSARLDALAGRLPPPLADGWLASAPQDKNAALKFQLERLRKLLDFNQRYSLHQMRLSNEQGEAVLVKQLYFGLSQAWFTSPDGAFRGYGRVENGKWHWQADARCDSASLLQAIAMLEKQSPAQAVALPLLAPAKTAAPAAPSSVMSARHE